MDLKEKKKNRFLFLKSLYEGSNGDTGAMFDQRQVGAELNFPYEETRRIVEYLIGEHLLEARAMGGIIALTHWGIKEVEQALENPDKPTEHFLPINIINIGSMNNSSLQQGTTNSTINFEFTERSSAELETIINSLKDIQGGLDVSTDLQKELISEIATLESQRESPRPKRLIITESLKSIRTILESVTGNAMTPIIVDQITRLLS